MIMIIYNIDKYASAIFLQLFKVIKKTIKKSNLTYTTLQDIRKNAFWFF